MKKLLMLTACCLLFTAYSNAQGPPPPPPPPPGPPPGTGAPIDTDIVLLFIATSLFGVYKLRKETAVSA